MDLKTNAFVKQDELDCYNWIHEEKLCIVAKLDILDEETFLFQAYNLDRKEWGAVTNQQIILLDKNILSFPPIMEDCSIMGTSDGEIIGIRFREESNGEIIELKFIEEE